MTGPKGPDLGRRVAGWIGGGASGFAAGVAGGVRWPDHKVAQVQRRTIGTLVVAQSLGGVGITAGIAVAALLAEQITGSETLAGLAQTAQVLGAAIASFLLAHLMGLRGRRPELVLGYTLGSAGAALRVVAGVSDSLATPERRARALSTVVWATTIGAVAGPNITGFAGSTARSLGLPPLTGPFLFGLAGMLVAALVIGVFMRPDPLLVAREATLARGGVVRTGTSWSRVSQVMRERPGVTAGVAALSLGHAVMVAVMVMTPLHMDHGGATLEIIGVVISGHVLGMFAFSPLVGWATDKLGRPAMLMAGAGVFFAALLLSGTAPAGASWQIGVGLFLLGLGWSFTTVASSTLLSESSPLDARTDVQGAADLIMGLTAAAAGVLAGVIVGALGYPALNVFAALLVTGVATAAEFARRTPKRPVDDDE